jgi:hypothetical protein
MGSTSLPWFPPVLLFVVEEDEFISQFVLAKLACEQTRKMLGSSPSIRMPIINEDHGHAGILHTPSYGSRETGGVSRRLLLGMWLRSVTMREVVGLQRLHFQCHCGKSRHRS